MHYSMMWNRGLSKGERDIRMVMNNWDIDKRQSSWIEQAAAYREGHIKVACFTGGEPFYDIHRLKRLFSFAVSRGLLPTVVTNAFWAESREEALEILKGMPELRVISVSTDQHHQAQIPFEKVKNALLAAKELGLTYNATYARRMKPIPNMRIY